MDSVCTNRPPLRSVVTAATRRSALLRPPRHLGLGNRFAETKLGIASGCGGGGYFGKVQGFDALRSTTTKIQSGKAERSVTKEMGHTSSGNEVPLKYSSGKAFPLGVSQVDDGLNFAIFSQHASSVTLCLKFPERGNQDDVDIVEFALDRQKNKTGDIWHVSVEGLPASGVLYGYHINGPQGWQQGHRFDDSVILLDPYAKLVYGRKHFAVEKEKPSQLFGTYDFIKGAAALGGEVLQAKNPEDVEPNLPGENTRD